MSRQKNCATLEKLIHAAIKISDHGKRTFTIPQMIVTAWEENKKELGLPGYRDEHPDCHRIMGSVYGPAGIISKGYIEVSEDTRYRLCTKVIRPDSEFSQRDVIGATSKSIQKMYRSNAFDYWMKSQRQMISFAECLNFYSIPTTAPHYAITEYLDDCTDTLNTAERLLEQDHLLYIDEMNLITIEIINLIRTLNSFLVERFRQHFELTKRRKPQKKC